MKPVYKIHSPFQPSGDQPEAIEKITSALSKTDHVCLRGVTGSGKTFTMAHTISKLSRPCLVMAPNKTLAAQLFTELREFFPDNSVNFFISYYDYYQPEAYIPNSDTYIAKDSAINEDIDKMRHLATKNLFERKDVIIVASVSCIYGLGSPANYSSLVVHIQKGQEIERDEFLKELIHIHYTRNDMQLTRGNFRARGSTVDILPSHEKEHAIRVEFFGDEIDRITIVNMMTGNTVKEVEETSIFPNSHYVTDKKDTKKIVSEILLELGVRLRELKNQNKDIEYQRLEQRTMQDIEMIEQLGFCPGIENYSRFLTGSKPGEPPPTLLDYFSDDFLTIIDESHITIPQVRGMYRGDRSRKQTLVDFGFRLPAALDNRPLNFDEFLERNNKYLYVSATPSQYESEVSAENIVEQVIRPTGLLDPVIEIRPATNQIDDLFAEINKTVAKKQRVLITTLTKKMSEEITLYYKELGIKVCYLHSDIDSLERVNILRELRRGTYDVLIGINLLREGLDLPEVSLVGILDADKQGFLRSKTSLIQTVGRAARHKEGRVIFYGDRITDAMQACIDVTNENRRIQIEYNEQNNQQPEAIIKESRPSLQEIYGLSEHQKTEKEIEDMKKKYKIKSMGDVEKVIQKKSKKMHLAAGELDFELAVKLRDEVAALKRIIIEANQ